MIVYIYIDIDIRIHRCIWSRKNVKTVKYNSNNSFNDNEKEVQVHAGNAKHNKVALAADDCIVNTKSLSTKFGLKLTDFCPNAVTR